MNALLYTPPFPYDTDILNDVALQYNISSIQWGCIVDDRPLTLRLQYVHSDGSIRRTEAIRPQRVTGWLMRDDLVVTETCNTMIRCDSRPCPDNANQYAAWRDRTNEYMIRARNRVRHVADDEADVEEDSITSDGACVYFYAEVSRANNLKLIKCLREATVSCLQHSTSPHSPPLIYLYIHSNGGDAFSGLAAYDHIRLNPVPIVTVADGMVASAASFMLLAADHRLIHENSFVRIHQLSIIGFDGKYADMVDEMQNTHSLMKKVQDMYVARTGMDTDYCHDLLRQEIDMDAERCLKEGLVHEVLRPVETPYRNTKRRRKRV